MNIRQIISENLQRTNLPSLDIELILAHILKKSREFILARPEYKLNDLQAADCQLLINKRKKYWPLAYLTGRKEFYGLDFTVDKYVLIPRPETELMVDEALKQAAHNAQRLTFIDIGVGSGCVIISLLKQLAHRSSAIGHRQFIAIDISKPALVNAKKNAKNHKVINKIKFIHGDLLEPVLNKSETINLKAKIIILANLPYLTPAQIKNSPSIKYEPKLALSAGPDGLKYYRRLFKQIKQLKSLGVMGYALCEIDPGQKNKIKTLIKNSFPGVDFQIKKDLRGHSRLAIIKI